MPQPKDAPCPSRWIQDFLNTTLGINKRKPDDGKGEQDPASSSGQIQLWQVIETARALVFPLSSRVSL